ncbi:MAG: CHAD domain-containing protein [Terriglobia bacterium]
MRAIALHRLDQMMGFEPKVLRGDKPQAIHDFRVASRRFEQALDLLCPPEPPHELLRLRRRIARSRKAVSAVRNYDVFIHLADKTLARKRPQRRETWEGVRDRLVKRRAKAHARAAAEIGKWNLSQVYLRLRAAIGPDVAPDGNARGASDDSFSLGQGSFRQKLAQETGRVWNIFESANHQASGAADPATIHSLRLAAKRLRYLVEIIHEFETSLSGLSGKPLQVLRSLQDRLGEWHDLEVEERILVKMAGRPGFIRNHLPLANGILRLITQNRKSICRLLVGPSLVLDSATNEQLKTCLSSVSGLADPS